MSPGPRSEGPTRARTRRARPAIGDVELVLRLARDLQPRAGLMTQIVCSAMASVVTRDVVPRLLAPPDCGAAQCDRLIGVLGDHADGDSTPATGR